jgi:pimeloyl-ACP methyl ester carboxylesterase
VPYRRGTVEIEYAWLHPEAAGGAAARVPAARFRVLGRDELWLDPAFREWTIEPLLPNIRCPLLAVQGTDDPYGTLAQIGRIAEAVPRTEMLVLDGAGHSLHRFTPPSSGRGCDWILVLDDASRGFALPGEP